MGVLLLAIGFIGVVFALVYGGAMVLANAWTNRFSPRGPAEQLAPSARSSVGDEAEAWLRSNPPGPIPPEY